MKHIILLFGICLLIWMILFAPDSTDKDYFHKSNLELHIDYGTGCHYLSTWTGIIMPRVDKNGQHICTGGE